MTGSMPCGGRGVAGGANSRGVDATLAPSGGAYVASTPADLAPMRHRRRRTGVSTFAIGAWPLRAFLLRRELLL